MKKILPAIFVVSALISCQADKNPDLPVDELVKRDVAMEIFSHSQTIVQIEYLSKEKHSDFLTAELLSKINQNPTAQRMYKNSAEESDTVFHLEELPVFSEIKTTTRIFDDGTSSTVIIDLTPDDANPANSFRETPVSDEFVIYKTVLENQQLVATNKSGEIIVREDFPVDNLTEFLDTVKYYVAQLQSDGSPQSVRSVNSLFLSKFQKNHTFETRILPNGNVVIENIELNQLLVSGETNITPSSSLKTISELDPQMSKILKFEVFNGNQLLSRKIFTYADNPLMRNSVYKKNTYGENPFQVDIQILITGSEGQPMIKTSREVYFKNQTIFNF